MGFRCEVAIICWNVLRRHQALHLCKTCYSSKDVMQSWSVCLFVWLVGCLVGWLFGLLVCLFGWLVGWFFGWLAVRFACLFVWLVGWLVGFLVGWLFGLLVCLFGWLVGWLVTAGGCCCWFRATSTMNVVSNLSCQRIMYRTIWE